MSFRQARFPEPLLSELPAQRTTPEVEEPRLPPSLRRSTLPLPDLSEFQVVRHYTRLSEMNYGVDTGLYPLGSCTMKYNPKYAERVAAASQARRIHPLQREDTVQGALQILYELQEFLRRISDMDAVSLQPAAGAQAELTGLLMARAYFEDRGEARSQVVLPDANHGTNFASAAMAGYDVVEVPSRQGVVDPEAVDRAVGRETAVFMLTNPNTLGLFEPKVLRIARLVHDAGGLLYYDGANLNAILGRTTPGAMEFDMAHFNLHKTFATPHGGGGPGAGPIGARGDLAAYLPEPMVVREGGRYVPEPERPRSIGKIRTFFGNFGVLLRAYAYIVRNGGDGLADATNRAVLHAAYLRHRLEEHLPIPHPGQRLHEFVASAEPLRERGLRAEDLAKRLIDYGIHPPTVYFPDLIEEALMIEPTESATRADLDGFVEAVAAILEEEDETLRTAPHCAAVGRVDQVRAARNPILSWRMMDR